VILEDERVMQEPTSVVCRLESVWNHQLRRVNAGIGRHLGSMPLTDYGFSMAFFTRLMLAMAMMTAKSEKKFLRHEA